MRQRFLFLFLSLSTTLMVATTNTVAETIIAPTSFITSPRLVDAVTTFNQVRVWGSTYYFTVEIPQNAQAPLKSITIHQREGSDTIRFFPEKTVAFLGTYRRKGQTIGIETISQNPETNAITLEFDQGIPPGSFFSVGLKPRRNPDYDGVYLFGVTVFPQGENPQGLYLGVGRLHFYRGGDGLY